jgi:protoporphyrinogen oxidase
MAVAVIGAGASGLACARRLAEAGIDCDVYERWPGLGGQAATMDVGDGLRIERYYHYLFTSDSIAIDAFEQLGLGDSLVSYPSSAAFAIDGRIWPFNGLRDLLRFRPLSLVDRLRMGLALLRLQLGRRGLAEYERQTASSWIRRNMGEAAWEHVWGPLMRGKFGERAEEISMAWIWDKVGKRRSLREGEARQERFIWPTGSFEVLFAELARRIEAAGGRVLVDRPAARLLRVGEGLALVPAAADSFRLGLDPRRFAPDGPPRPYEAIVCCVPNDVFAHLLDPGLAGEVGREYLARLEAIEYFTALNLVLELERPLTEHFWVNVADRRFPFVGLIEHSNFVGTENTGGRVFSHVTNYLPADHELLGLDAEQLLDRYDDGLRMLNPSFERSWVRRSWVFREPAGQPIVGVGYRELIPPRRTPVAGLLLVNTTQIYPQDRGINFAIRDGELAASEVIAGLGA